MRRRMLDTYRALPGVSIVVSDDRGGKPTVDQRRRCLTVLIAALMLQGLDYLKGRRQVTARRA